MALDPRPSAFRLWLLWIAAAAVGGGFMATFVVVDFEPMLSPFGYVGNGFLPAFAVVGAMFQGVLLFFVAPRKRPALWWLPATVVAIAIYPWLAMSWRGAEPAVIGWLTGTFGFLNPLSTGTAIDDAATVTYAIALGLAQGVILAVMTRRGFSIAMWLAGNIVGWFAMYQAAQTLLPVVASLPAMAASNAIMTALYAAPAGLALVAIFRRGPAQNPARRLGASLTAH